MPKTVQIAKREIASLREVFARNLTAALKHQGLIINAEVSRRAKRLGYELQATTVSRAKAGKHAPNLDTVEALCQVSGFQSWQLLFEGFSPTNPPIVRMLTEDEKALYRKIFGTPDPAP